MYTVARLMDLDFAHVALHNDVFRSGIRPTEHREFGTGILYNQTSLILVAG